MKNIKSIITILLILVIVFPLIIRGINYIKEKKEQKNRDESPIEKIRIKESNLDVFIETYKINKGSKIRVYTHPGYTYERYSEGWKYYFTPQNGIKTIRGDGSQKHDSVLEYFDLEFYAVECTIKIIYTKINKAPLK